MTDWLVAGPLLIIAAVVAGFASARILRRMFLQRSPVGCPEPEADYAKQCELDENGWHVASINEGLRLARLCNGTASPQDLAAGIHNTYPTDDAYVRACRALNWRHAELRFYGIEPITLAEDAPHHPPEDFDFGFEHDK